MPRAKKEPGAGESKPKRSAAQIRADERYREKNKERNAENARARYAAAFRSIGAQMRTEEAERVAATFRAYGVTVAQVIRAGWYALITDAAAAELIRANAATAAEKLKAQTAEQQAQRAQPNGNTGNA